jgi:S1-C subfamily serine protease
MKSQLLDAFVHVLPSVRPVYFDKGGLRYSGTVVIVSTDGKRVSRDGLAVTNEHVVRGSNGTVQVILKNADGTEEERSAHVVKVDPQEDLALVQLDRKPGETFPALPLSRRWRPHELLAELGNAGGQGSISMAIANADSLINQSMVPFDKRPPEVSLSRPVVAVAARSVPGGYSGGAVIGIAASEQGPDGRVHRKGTIAARAITVYSDRTDKAYGVPSSTVLRFIEDYKGEQVLAKHK